MFYNNRKIKADFFFIYILILHIFFSTFCILKLYNNLYTYLYIAVTSSLIISAYLFYRYYKSVVYDLEASLDDRSRLTDVVMESAGNFIFEIEPGTGKMLNINQAVSKRLGIYNDDLRGMNLTDILMLSGEDMQEIMNCTEMSIKTVSITIYKPPVHMELFKAGKSALENRMMVFANDISEDVRLNARYKMISDIMDASVNEVHIFRFSDLKYIYANKAALKNLGYTFDEFLNLRPMDIVTGMSEEKMKEVLSLTEQQKYVSYNPQRRKDGSIYNAEAHLQLFSTPEGKFYVAVVLDIEDKKKVESALERANASLEKLNAELSRKVEEEVSLRLKNEQILFEQKKFADIGYMMGAVSHQWRQPLNALGLVLQSIAEDVKNGDLSDINMLKDEGMHLVSYLSETIDDFRNYFKSDTETKEFNIAESLCQAVHLIQRQLDSLGIEISMQCVCDKKEINISDFEEIPECSHKNLVISGMEGKFKQIIMNLLYNSVEALTSGKRSGRKFIRITVKSGSDSIYISVTDNAGGIPEEIKDKVFSPYFSTKKNLNGPGIGLYMAKTILNKHMSADIDFYNTEDGTCFFISFMK